MSFKKDLVKSQETGKRHKTPPPGSNPIYRDGVQLLREDRFNDPLGQTPSIQAEDPREIKGTMGDLILGRVFLGDGSSMLMENLGPFVPAGASDIMSRRFRRVRSQEDVERACDGDGDVGADVGSSDGSSSSEGPSGPCRWVMQILKSGDGESRGATIIATGTVVPTTDSLWLASLSPRDESGLSLLEVGARFGMIPLRDCDGVQATRADLLLFTVLSFVDLDDGRVSLTLEGGFGGG